MISFDISLVAFAQQQTLHLRGLQSQFLSPLVAKFSFELTFAQYNQINNNPYGLVKFTVNGRKIEGWLLNLQFKPDDISEFELMLKK